MKENIVIVGGGISGLSLLHYLKQKVSMSRDIDIQLYERNAVLGGAIQTTKRNDCLFELGPQGFLNNSPGTLELIQQLNLDHELIESKPDAKRRYIQKNNDLFLFPMNPKEFLLNPVLNPLDKIRIFNEQFVPKGTDPLETAYAFAQRRFGEKAARYFMDPFVKGLCGGDASKIILKELFPRIYEIEQQHGSLMKGMMQRKKAGKDLMPKTKLLSFRSGVSTLIHALSEKYKDAIHVNQKITSITYELSQYVLHTKDNHFTADKLVVATPAYHAAELLRIPFRELSEHLDDIQYSPIAVIGLVYNREDCPHVPPGYGYLVPSCENKNILGVLFESNIFDGRSANDQMLLRLMIGGTHHPDIVDKTELQLIDMALHEVETCLKIKGKIKDMFFTFWRKAIPQYDLKYLQTIERMENELKQCPNLYLSANYLNGISMNDCIENAYLTSKHFSF